MLQFTPDDIKRIQARVQKNPALLKNLRNKTEFFFQYGVKVPVGTQSTWIMHFVCPVDSAKLHYDYASEHEYVCPVCGRTYSGEPYSGAWWRYTVEKVVDNSIVCALIWLITGEEKYKEIACEVLDRYAENYSTYELHGGIIYNNPGKINSQTLCEALTIRSLATTYDLIADAMPEAWKEKIINNLLLPSAQVLCEQRMDQIHNHEVVIDSAMCIVGMVTNNEQLIEKGLNSKYGLRYQLEHGVLDDGLWFEGTVHYHYFMLWACMMFEKFACNTPYSLRHLGIYEKMYSMPLGLMKPDFHMPCLGDGNGNGMFEELAEHYEFPYRMLHTEDMARLLQKVYSVKARDGMEALVYGVDEIEDVEPLKLRNYHDNEASGLTTFHGAHEQFLLFKHGKFGGEHDHYDRLGIAYAVGDNDIIPDFGTVGYNAPHHYPYFKNTFTHNTVCINGVNQAPADGHTLVYEAREHEMLVESYVDWLGAAPDLDSLIIKQWDEEAYRGIRMNRVLLARDEYIVEAFLVRNAKDKTVDWLLHPRGSFVMPQHTTPAVVGDSAPQCFLHDAVSVSNAGVVESVWKQEKGELHVYSACSSEGRILYAQGPDNPPEKTVTYIMNRVEANGDDILFMNVICYEEKPGRIQDVVMRNEGRKVMIDVTYDGVKRNHVFEIGQN